MYMYDSVYVLPSVSFLLIFCDFHVVFRVSISSIIYQFNVFMVFDIYQVCGFP